MPGTLAASSCATIRVDELEHIAQLVLGRFQHDGAPASAFVDSIASLTGGLSFVRRGSHQIAGKHDARAAPCRQRARCATTGVSYTVTSFVAAAPQAGVRVYLLVPS